MKLGGGEVKGGEERLALFVHVESGIVGERSRAEDSFFALPIKSCGLVGFSFYEDLNANRELLDLIRDNVLSA